MQTSGEQGREPLEESPEATHVLEPSELTELQVRHGVQVHSCLPSATPAHLSLGPHCGLGQEEGKDRREAWGWATGAQSLHSDTRGSALSSASYLNTEPSRSYL